MTNTKVLPTCWTGESIAKIFWGEVLWVTGCFLLALSEPPIRREKGRSATPEPAIRWEIVPSVVPERPMVDG